LGIGIILSALRWLLIDTLHHGTGLTASALDFALLQDRLDVFLVAVEHNYRFYQFYSNLCVSLISVPAEISRRLGVEASAVFDGSSHRGQT
jgi:hypothetical protein